MTEVNCLIERNNAVIAHQNDNLPVDLEVTHKTQQHLECVSCQLQCLRIRHRNASSQTVDITIRGLGGICTEGIQEKY